MIVLVERGHGIETLGNCSPDGALREWKYCNDIAVEVVKQLKSLGYNAQLLVPEETNIPLGTRSKRANDVCRHFGPSNVLLVSIHLNAKGNGSSWCDVRGWQACVSLNASAKSKQLASYLFDSAQAQGLKMRRPKAGQKWWAQNLAICRDTLCPAVLTENLFQDNQQDVAYLLSEEGRKTIINLHVEGIVNYIKSL